MDSEHRFTQNKSSERIHTQVAAMPIPGWGIMSSFVTSSPPSFFSSFFLNFLNTFQWAFMTFGISRNVHWVLWVLLSTCSDPKASSCSGLPPPPCRAYGTRYSGCAVQAWYLLSKWSWEVLLLNGPHISCLWNKKLSNAYSQALWSYKGIMLSNEANWDNKWKSVCWL